MGNSNSIFKRAKVSISPFEKIPSELLFTIIDHVPYLVYDLRLCSKTLKTRTDQYAARPGIKLVQKLTLHSSLSNGSNTISMIAYKSTKNLLELHLKLLPDTYGFKININGIVSSVQYQIPLTDGSLKEDMMNSLQYCTGKTVGTVEVFYTLNHNSWHFFSHLLEKVRFKSLRIRTGIISENSARDILKLIGDHSVDHLHIYNEKNTLSDPKKFLLEISTIVQSLQIDFQERSDRFQRELPNLLGIHEPDGSSIIVDMFSRKLDKLSINVCSHELPPEWFDTLCEHLPYLGKNVWFILTGRVFYHERNVIINDHIVRGSKGELIIKHISRKYEQFGC